MRRPGIFAPAGKATDPNMMLAWQPGLVTCYYDFLRQNQLFAYKNRQPKANILVRFQHPRNWHLNSEQSAVAFGRQVAGKWAELQPLDPYICFANGLNLYYENGDSDPRNQPNYETEAYYQRIGQWVARTAQIIKNDAPDIKLVTPAFSPGRHEDGTPDDFGQITESFAGYDFLSEAIKTYFDSRLAYHAYWGNIDGSRREWLYDRRVASWHAFRWQRILTLFAARYNIQANIIIDEASNYAAYDLDLFEQLTYFSRQTLSDTRVLGLSFYQWEDPTLSPGNIFNVWTEYILDLPGFIHRLAALPEVAPGSATTNDGGAIGFDQQDLFDGPVIRVSFTDGSIVGMPLETYLRAVVPAEMPALWPAEALKAQAVAARSFALKSLARARRNNQPADITSTYARSQQFDSSKVHPASDQAILATKGQVVRQNGHVIDALFSANCGGHTFNNEDVTGFSRNPISYLRGVPCPAPGPKYGHGIGLCQHGARAFAEQGRTYAQILAHYYQNTVLESMPES